jgi:hypothetical protein
MCLIDEKEIRRFVAAEEDFKLLKKTVDLILVRLTDAGYTISLADYDPSEYVRLKAVKEEYL